VVASQSKKRAPEESVSTTPLVYGLDPQGLNKAFPFHFIFNQKLEVLQCGKVPLTRLTTATMATNSLTLCVAVLFCFVLFLYIVTMTSRCRGWCR
jgi:hypothetical protein